MIQILWSQSTKTTTTKTPQYQQVFLLFAFVVSHPMSDFFDRDIV